MTIEEKIYSVVKDRCEQSTNAYGIGAWEHHIKIVYELAKQYANDYEADQEIVALAALLHDIASVTNVDFTEEHHIIGADIAEKILMDEKYPNEKIDLIKKCILNHRGSILKEKTTPEEVCVADCDAIAHFCSISSLFKLSLNIFTLPIFLLFTDISYSFIISPIFILKKNIYKIKIHIYLLHLFLQFRLF
jgi:uncharacterized protein